MRGLVAVDACFNMQFTLKKEETSLALSDQTSSLRRNAKKNMSKIPFTVLEVGRTKTNFLKIISAEQNQSSLKKVFFTNQEGAT
jgi:hypothetical protein